MALYAAKDEEIRKRVRGIACLSTPFLVTKRRNNVFWHVDTDRGRAALADAAYAMLFGILLVAAIGVYATTGFPVRPEEDTDGSQECGDQIEHESLL